MRMGRKRAHQSAHGASQQAAPVNGSSGTAAAAQVRPVEGGVAAVWKDAQRAIRPIVVVNQRRRMQHAHMLNGGDAHMLNGGDVTQVCSWCASWHFKSVGGSCQS